MCVWVCSGLQWKVSCRGSSHGAHAEDAGSIAEHGKHKVLVGMAEAKRAAHTAALAAEGTHAHVEHGMAFRPWLGLGQGQGPFWAWQG